MSTGHVLLVDDEAIVLDVLSLALQKKGLTVKTASKAGDAVTLLKAEHFDCLLVDKKLPDASGLDVIKRARELQPFCACLVMTGYPNVESILQALRLGAVDYLEKPFPQMALVQEKVLQAVSRQRILAERETLLRHLETLRGGDAATLHQELEALRRVQTETDALQGRFDALTFRHQRSVTLLRHVLGRVSALLEGHALPVEAERELRELERTLSTALADVQ